MCCLWNIDVTVSVLRQILVSFHFVSFNELWTNHSSINIIGNQIITLILCLSSSSSNMKRHFELLMWNIRFNRWIKCLSCCFWMFYIVIYVYQHVFVWFPRTVPRILRSRIVDFCCFGIVFFMMASNKPEKDVIVYEKDLDMSSSSRGVWLVKVPKYISNKWNKCPGNIDAGRLNITK